MRAHRDDNVNPNLLVAALEQRTGETYEADITRNELYNAEMEPFR